MRSSTSAAFLPPRAFPTQRRAYCSPRCQQAPPQPSPTTPSLLDLENVLTIGERQRLQTTLSDIQNKANIRISLLTQSERTAPGRKIQTVFPQDENSVLIVAEPSSPNLLRFRVGETVKQKLPPSFWNELANRYGNSFYVRETGADVALLQALQAVQQCATVEGRICRFVPGVSTDQLAVSVCCAAAAGALVGVVARTGGEKFNARYVALYSPLWGIFFVSFGLGPVLARVPGASWQLASVVAAFVSIVALVWIWVPIGIGPPGRDSTPDV
ncbi:Thylakoid lumenal 15.0 kDa protein 2, chloroplastic [Gracilariopsis chorda]|uniref:Thylakoid lumenal 15.0 kDa protein 2, chloroplastic n=1 Tax=Gracilariopsis chorda TaxID=448386 RepID=A0A2V3IDC3_9FLOR|nr:Thylakoid lumenal 15.0 kDa protein 2, chloroplastic [Gracilariopsis chorda]|eukprot:PXF40082.1 Thylakoid lumenal 15.0 kDa protein 2, chloroplastic [Gracilariopsis chorda]